MVFRLLSQWMSGRKSIKRDSRGRGSKNNRKKYYYRPTLEALEERACASLGTAVFDNAARDGSWNTSGNWTTDGGITHWATNYPGDSSDQDYDVEISANCDWVGSSEIKVDSVLIDNNKKLSEISSQSLTITNSEASGYSMNISGGIFDMNGGTLKVSSGVRVDGTMYMRGTATVDGDVTITSAGKMIAEDALWPSGTAVNPIIKKTLTVTGVLQITYYASTVTCGDFNTSTGLLLYGASLSGSAKVKATATGTSGTGTVTGGGVEKYGKYSTSWSNPNYNSSYTSIVCDAGGMSNFTLSVDNFYNKTGSTITYGTGSYADGEEFLAMEYVTVATSGGQEKLFTGPQWVSGAWNTDGTWHGLSSLYLINAGNEGGGEWVLDLSQLDGPYVGADGQTGITADDIRLTIDGGTPIDLGGSDDGYQYVCYPSAGYHTYEFTVVDEETGDTIFDNGDSFTV